MPKALITGASEGLGKALAKALAAKGMSLILVARTEEKLKALAAELPVPTQIVVCDLCDPGQRNALTRLIQKEVPELIINNAGFGLYGPAISHPPAESKDMVELNVQATLELSLEGAKALFAANKKGAIVNISSAAAFVVFPTFCLYAATKAFVNHFSQGLDQEMKKYGIRILTICPGQIDTGFRKKASRGFPQKHDCMTMQPEKAVRLILKHIDLRTPLAIIDGKYRLAVALSKWLPKRLLYAMLQRSIGKRFLNQKS